MILIFFSRVFYNKLVIYFIEFSSVWVCPMFCLDEIEVAHHGGAYCRGGVLSMLCQRCMMSIQLLLVMLTLTP